MATQDQVSTTVPGNRGHEKVASSGSTNKSKLRYEISDEERKALEEAKASAPVGKEFKDSAAPKASTAPKKHTAPKESSASKASAASKESAPKGAGAKKSAKQRAAPVDSDRPYRESLRRLPRVSQTVVYINDVFDQAEHALAERGLPSAARVGEVLKKTTLTVPALMIMGHQRWLHWRRQ